MIELGDMNRAACQRYSDWALQEYGQGKSSAGRVKITLDPETRKGREDTAREHFENADRHFASAQEAARGEERGNCAECLGKLGVELCPLLSETEVTIKSLFESLTARERERVRRAYNGEALRKSPDIARKIGTLTSDIDEDYYARYLEPAPEKREQVCPFKLDPAPTTFLAEEIARGVDRRVLGEIVGLGAETPAFLSNGRLTSTENMASYLDPEDILGPDHPLLANA